jgi:hypothetical protein
MRDKLERRINLLTIYAVVSTLALGTLVFTSFKNKENNILTDELTVKRINLIDEDGSLRMVISNEKRQHPGRINGKNLAPRERPAGILFFNNQGDECGGLVYNVTKEKNSTNSGMSFTMDNYHNDQVVQILNDETYNGNNSSDIQRGIMVNEFPEGADFNATNDKYQAILKIKDTNQREAQLNALFDKEGSRRRLFLGRNRDNKSGLFLYDSEGNPKMKIYVDKQGTPRFEVIDNSGKINDILSRK